MGAKIKCVVLLIAVASLGSESALAAKRTRDLTLVDAVRIVTHLFPGRCGWGGNQCSIGLANNSNRHAPDFCPAEIWVTFPDEVQLPEETPSTPRTAWIALDEFSHPIAIGTSKRLVCANT